MDDATSNYVLVTGSRSIKDAAVVARILDALPFRVSKLVHGGAPGVDVFAGAWATQQSPPIAVKVVRPDFAAYPVRTFKWKAYIERDYAMVREADIVVAIWDGKSGGTRKTFEYAETQGKLFHVHTIK
jgi:hypothetical protein